MSKDEDKWITVDPRTKKLAIRFRVRGFDKQFYIASGLKDTKRNREIVRTERDAIATDITLDRFDETLDSYQFNQKPKFQSQSPISVQYSLAELWEKFTDFKSKQLEETTILAKYKPIARYYISKLPTQDMADASIIRDWMLENYTLYMSWVLLDYFSACCDWAVKSGLTAQNPFANLKIQKPKKTSQDENFRAFTLDQRDLIIQTFECHPRYGHYAPLVKFLFFTGCRPGEAFALTWGDISSDCCRIVINKSCNYRSILKGTKNGKKRVFPSQVGSRLQLLLLSIRPEHAEPHDLIFSSKTGASMNSDIMLNFWKEERFCSKGKTYKRPGLVAELSVQGLVPYLPPYSLSSHVRNLGY